jgi:two-component sensor histidine kinase/uncharacterized protein YjbJ (UPF0337 family)
MALLLGVALIPMGALTLNAGLKAASLSETSAQQKIAERVRIDVSERQKEATSFRAAAGALAANFELARLPRHRCNAVLSSVLGEFREFSAVALLDQDARAVCASDPAVVGRKTMAAPLIAAAAANRGPATGYIARSQISNEPVIEAVAPLNGAPGLYIGVTRPIMSLLARRPTDDSSFALLADAEGQVLASAGLAADSGALASLRAALARGALAEPGYFRAGGLWAVAAPLGEGGLYLVQGWRNAPSQVSDALRTFWALFAPLAVWFVAIACTWYAVELYIVRPLTGLERLARAYARGEQLPASNAFDTAPIEIASLRRTLSAMAKTLRGREHRLTEALQEERALLRELNHRVNNNLQLVVSLLSIQSRAAPTEEQAVGFERAHERVQLLALAQSRIYASGRVREAAPLDEMIADIARTIFKARGAHADNVELQLSLAPVRASIDHAVPLAFLVGESISHALDLLQDGPRAPLDVSLSRDDGTALFSVTSPLPAGARRAVASPAKRIIEAFAGQIGAEMGYDARDALTVRIAMKVNAQDGEDAAPGNGSESAAVVPERPTALNGKEATMNWAQVEGKWDQMKGAVQKQWGKLTDDDLSRARGSRDEFIGRVKERYGIAREEAERQVDDFFDRLPH